jgi:very-short-patch-repair endonuclease
VDGDSHYTDVARLYDEARSEWLKAQGIRVLRFTNAEVMQEFEAVGAKVLEALG